MTRRDFLARAGLSLTAGAVGLGVAEIAARLFRPQAPLVRLDQFADLVGDVHRIRAEDVFEADAELFWRFAPGITLPDEARPLFGVISNGSGFRASREFEAVKPDGTIRILFVGDSCTFGYLVAHDRTFVAVAERSLRRRFPDRNIECINAGVPGYTLFQGWRLLETRAPGLQPDLVVLNFGWNEPASWDGLGDIEHYQRQQAVRPIPALDWSRFCRLLLEVVEERSTSGPRIATRPRILPHEFRELLGKCKMAADRMGAELLVLVGAGRSNVLPTPFRDYLTPWQEEQLTFGEQLRLGGAAEAGFVNEVEVLQAMAAVRPPAEIFFDGVHTTPDANARIGEAIARRLEPWVAARTA